jgi:hypothetical protein
MRESFKSAGMQDFTLRVYPKAGHSLVVSGTGYEDEPSRPLRLAPGYLMAMIDWLRQRQRTPTARIGAARTLS